MQEEDILNEIFEYLFSTVKSSPNNHRKIKKEKEPHIKEKININFSESQTYVKQTYFNNIHYINLANTFIQNKLKIKPEPVYALVDNVQSLYLKYRKAADVNLPINDYKIIDKIAVDLLPKRRKNRSEFKSAAKSIVLYIFEMCDIGLPPKPTKKVRVPKRLAQMSFFDNTDNK